MKRTLLALCIVISLLSVIGFSRPSLPPLPQATIPIQGFGMGHCVALFEGDTMIGQPLLVPMRPSRENYDTFIVSTSNAAWRIAQSSGRPDIASKTINIRWAAPGTTPSADGMTCVCTNTVWSGDPRKGGTVTGCMGACGSCASCRVTPSIE